MYVLPPPPPPNGAAARLAAGVPLADINNSIKSDLGPEFDLNLSEGTYTLRDEILLGVIPPHPSDPLPANVHVLDPKPPPLTAGVKLSLAVIAPRKTSPRLLRRLHTSSSATSSLSQTTSTSKEDSAVSGSDNGSNTLSSQVAAASIRASVFGDGNPALIPVVKNAKDKDKRRKPTSSIVKSSSSFISRVTPHDMPTKRMAEHDPAGIYAFMNTNRAFIWLDLSAQEKPATSNVPASAFTVDHPKIDPLCKILFTKAFALCHDVNKLTLAQSHMDIVIGFNTSDFLWWDPVSQKYNRLNKNGAITTSPPVVAKWIPGSENLFMAAHTDGTLIVYDKEKEDAPFVAENDPAAQSSRKPRILVHKSVQSKNQKTNPVAVYKAAKGRINDFAYSPSGQHVASVCEDGTLRVIDLFREELIDLQPSYYGGFTCVTWSPDGLYLLTGGEDDTVSLWDVSERSLVARCIGHKSWVSGLAFDPWRCDDQGNYRFASIGEDCRILFWDFSVGMLARPRQPSLRYNMGSAAPSRSQSSTTVQRVGMVNGTSTPTNAQEAKQMASDSVEVDAQEETVGETGDRITHRVVPKAACAKLPPVLSKLVDTHPLSWIGFEEDCLIVACQSGHIQTFDRPPPATEKPVGMVHKSNGSMSFSNPFLSGGQ